MKVYCFVLERIFAEMNILPECFMVSIVSDVPESCHSLEGW
jgi:hypothetical protein